MVFEDTVDRMIDGADDLSEVQQNHTKQVIELALTNAQGVAEEIAPEEDFKAAQYGSELGVKTLARYYSTYVVPDGVAFSTPEGAQAFEAPAGNVAQYKQALMACLRFSVP